MQFSLVIQSSPFNGTAALRALETAQQLLRDGHHITRLFFYQDGVFNGAASIVTPQPYQDLGTDWQALIQEHKLDAVVCVSSALSRGILDEAEAKRYEKGSGNILNGFTLGGLGLLVDAMATSDRVLGF